VATETDRGVCNPNPNYWVTVT